MVVPIYEIQKHFIPASNTNMALVKAAQVQQDNTA
jgi:hypothetical protein